MTYIFVTFQTVNKYIGKVRKLIYYAIGNKMPKVEIYPSNPRSPLPDSSRRIPHRTRPSQSDRPVDRSQSAISPSNPTSLSLLELGEAGGRRGRRSEIFLIFNEEKTKFSCII